MRILGTLRQTRVCVREGPVPPSRAPLDSSPVGVFNQNRQQASPGSSFVHVCEVVCKYACGNEMQLCQTKTDSKLVPGQVLFMCVK